MRVRSVVRRVLLGGACAILGVLVVTVPGLRLTNRVHRSLSLEQKRRFFHAFVEASSRAEGFYEWLVCPTV